MKKNKKAFTLIELMLVMALIAILSTLMLPNLKGAQDKAKEASLRAVVHAMQVALENYYLDHQKYPLGTATPAEQMVALLKQGDYLNQTPKNPFTGKPYQASDQAGQIVYDYNADTDQYVIKAYGRKSQQPLLLVSNLEV
jgi:general secretion pathway protein G